MAGKLDRRTTLTSAGAVLLAGAATGPVAPAADDPQSAAVIAAGPLAASAGSADSADWATLSPEEAGFRPQLGTSWDALRVSGRIANVHGVVALRHGRIVFERYLPGTDFAWGRALGEVTFGPDTRHDMRSVTKSVVGLLYGIALAQGRVPSPDQPLLAHFPEYPDLAADPARAALTVRHVLTMTMGTAWNEDVPYTSDANSEIAMERAPDRYRFILSRPILGPPGQGWIYSGGATALLGRLIEKGTGQDLPAFAQSALFAPLGFPPTEWARGEDGEASAASGLRLAPRELARIGLMLMAGGVWAGKPVVPADWVAASLRPLAVVDDIRRYGYHWYLGDFALTGRTGVYGTRWFGAFGNGGQRLFAFPELDFLLVVTAGNYDTADQWRPPVAILREVFLANLAT